MSDNRPPPREKISDLPLHGIRLVEFCQVASGPFCSMLLADMGADVVKVEPPAGDMLRQWPPLTNGFSENFAALNRNKRSIVLDLKNEDDRRTARRLIASADVVLENNRPGAMDRLGLGYNDMCQDHPALIYCSISAFGQEGPRAEEGGFDVTIQGISGIMSVTGEPDGSPVKCGVPVSDFSAGLYAAYAISVAMLRMRETGRGAHIDISMQGASLGISALQTSEYFGSGNDPKPLGSAHPRNAPYQAFAAADGHFVVAAGNNKLWRSVRDVLGVPELAHDPRFLNTSDRARNQADLKLILAPLFKAYRVQDMLGMLNAEGVPCSPINSYSAALEDPQVQYMGWVETIELPSPAPGPRTTTRTFGSPIRFSGEAFRVRSGPPALGADQKQILEELEKS